MASSCFVGLGNEQLKKSIMAFPNRFPHFIEIFCGGCWGNRELFSGVARLVEKFDTSARTSTQITTLNNSTIHLPTTA
jgi:hypothetical protein